MKCALPVGRLSVLRATQRARLMSTFVLAARLVDESSCALQRTRSAHSTAIGRSPTIGRRGVSLVVFGHRRTR